MVWIAVAMALLMLLAILIIKKAREQKKGEDSLPYAKADALFTPAERSFFGVLTQAIGSDFIAFGKVRVADVLIVKNGLDASARLTAFNRISAKHFDFVLCSPTDLSVLCAIELNDKSHNQKARQERDAFIENACKVASLPLITFPAQAAYSVAMITSTIAAALTSPRSTKNSPVPGNENHLESDIAPAPIQKSPIESPLCPKCSSLMIKRIAKAGSNAGQQFWGCSKFPSCRGMIAV